MHSSIIVIAQKHLQQNVHMPLFEHKDWLVAVRPFCFFAITNWASMPQHALPCVARRLTDMRGENQVIMHDCLLESRQDLSCTYLTESVVVVINMVITIVIDITFTSLIM